MSAKIAVAVVGATGRMGQTTCEAIENSDDLQLVARLGSKDEITAESLAGAQVAVEFTVPSASFANTAAILRAGAHAVVGTSGWDEDAQVKIQEVARETGRNVLIVPNFALSAVLVMAFSRLAAPFFASNEIVETHHPKKLMPPVELPWQPRKKWRRRGKQREYLPHPTPLPPTPRVRAV